MTPNPLQQILDTAQKSGLISSVQRVEITRDFEGEKPSTMSDAASFLVTHNVLTKEQAQRILTDLATESTLASRYQILEKLGEGGMGAVFKARDTKLDREVAIKVMAAHQVQHPDAVARFHREAKALAKVSHPSIVQAFDADQDGERHFLVMELVAGQNLARLIQENGRIAPTRAADYVYQAALGIQHAHERGLIHRDLKPANLLVAPGGQVKILDLGLARFAQDLLPDSQVTREGTGLGTPDYMAPEQFTDARHVDARADIYALGCTLYHLVTGKVPFPGSSLAEKATAHETKDATPLHELCPDAPAGLALAIAKMMAKSPADRFQSAREAAEALAPYVASSSSSVQKIIATTSWEGSQLSFTVAKKRRKRAIGGAMVACGFAALAPVAFLLAWPWLFPAPVDAPHPNPNPQANADKANANKTPELKIAKNEPKDNQAKSDGKKKIEQKTATKPPAPKIVTIPNGLTVAKDGTGQYATIGAALAKVEPGQTICILDEAVYQESIHLRNSSRYRGLTLISPRHATIEFPPQATLGLVILNVPQVTVSGLRFRTTTSGTTCIGVGGPSHGTLLIDLDFISENVPKTTGISLDGVDLTPDQEPIRVARCTFKGLGNGIELIGVNLSTQAPNPLRRVSIRDNRFDECIVGIWALGQLNDIQIVGNRIWNYSEAGIRLAGLQPKAGRLLVANNTIKGIRNCLEITSPAAGVEGIEICSNVTLTEMAPDLRVTPKPKALPATWVVAKNWRRVLNSKKKGADAQAQLDSPHDTFVEELALDSLDARVPGFLRPAKDSPLATAGNGGDLPGYVGAIPPDGVEPWNWQWTWDALIDKTLTVSKAPKSAGRFKSINRALDKVRPGMTIRILDKEIYAESLSLTSPTTQDGITLESPLGATLSADQNDGFGITIKGVRGLTVRGLRLRADAPKLTMIYVKESAPGLLLDRLTLEAGSASDYDGVFFYLLAAAAADPPAILKNCTFHKPQIGVGVSGKDFANEYRPCAGVAVRDNLILEPSLFGIKLSGHLQNIQVVGNRIGKCARLGSIQFEDLAPATRNLLLANNTVCDAPHAFRLWDSSVNGTNIRICNNLFLASAHPDMVFFDSGGSPTKLKGPGDGRQFQKKWTMSHNWRETVAPSGTGLMEKAWVPPAPLDVLKDRIEVLSRLPTDPDYLKLPAGSPLAKAGAGGDLPAYVGALPPNGISAWDWEKTWQKWRNKRP